MMELKDRPQLETEGKLQCHSCLTLMERTFTSLQVCNWKVHMGQGVLTVLASLGGVVGPTSSAKGTALSMIPAGCRAAKQPCLCHVTSFPTRPQLVESGRNTGLTREASWLPAGL